MHFAKCTTLYRVMNHVRPLWNVVISTIVRVYHVYHVKTNISSTGGNRVNLMVVSQKDSQLNFLMAWTPHNSWYTSIFGDMGVVPSIPNQKYG